MNWKSLSVWIESLEKAGFKVKNVIIWDKVVHGLNYQNYAYTYEMIIFATKGTFFPHNKNDGNKFYRDVWHIKRNLDNESEKIEHHETQKAIEVVKLPLKHASEPGNIILDPFMGSGTTAVACRMLNRHFIGFEIIKEYCDIANMRLKEYMKQTNLIENHAPAKPESQSKPDTGTTSVNAKMPLLEASQESASPDGKSSTASTQQTETGGRLNGEVKL